jgi:hypothetical protein
VLQLGDDYKELIDYYYGQVTAHFRIYGKTSETQIDSLILIYKLTKNDRIFSLIFQLHKKLLIGISYKTYNKYKTYLYEEDLYDLQSMMFNEFYRRVMFYSIPPQAPFSKWVKMYITKWSNSYIKLTVKHNQKFIHMNDAPKENDDDI